MRDIVFRVIVSDYFVSFGSELDMAATYSAGQSRPVTSTSVHQSHSYKRKKVGTTSSVPYSLAQPNFRNSLQRHQIPRLVLPSLHLTVHYSRIFSSSVDMMDLGDEAGIGDCWMQNVINVD